MVFVLTGTLPLASFRPTLPHCVLGTGVDFQYEREAYHFEIAVVASVHTMYEII